MLLTVHLENCTARSFYSARGLTVSPISPSRCAPPPISHGSDQAHQYDYDVLQSLWNDSALETMEARGAAAALALAARALPISRPPPALRTSPPPARAHSVARAPLPARAPGKRRGCGHGKQIRAVHIAAAPASVFHLTSSSRNVHATDTLPTITTDTTASASVSAASAHASASASATSSTVLSTSTLATTSSSPWTPACNHMKPSGAITSGAIKSGAINSGTINSGAIKSGTTPSGGACRWRSSTLTLVDLHVPARRAAVAASAAMVPQKARPSPSTRLSPPTRPHQSKPPIHAPIALHAARRQPNIMRKVAGGRSFTTSTNYRTIKLLFRGVNGR